MTVSMERHEHQVHSELILGTSKSCCTNTAFGGIHLTVVGFNHFIRCFSCSFSLNFIAHSYKCSTFSISWCLVTGI